MPKNPNPSKLDFNQYNRLLVDDENDAQRVIIVGASDIQLNVSDIKFPEMPKSEVISVPVIIKEIEKVEIPVIIKESAVQTIEIPTIVKEIQVQTIEVPVIVKEIQVITVEKPVITTIYEKIEVPVVVEKLIQAEFPIWAKALLLVQGLSSLIGLITLLIKK